MDKQIDSNFIKSSNLIFGTAGLGLVNLLLSNDIFNNSKSITVGMMTLVLIAGLGFLVRSGKNWVKYLLLVFTIVGLLTIPLIIGYIHEKPLVGIINIAQTVMQIWAMMLLFKISRA